MILCLATASCENNNDNYPQNYVGFSHSLQKLTVGDNQPEIKAEIKIIAAQKANYDRTVVLATPKPLLGQASIFELPEKEVTLKAGRKSTTITIKVFPERMILKKQNIHITCTPLWEEGEVSRLSFQLRRK